MQTMKMSCFCKKGASIVSCMTMVFVLCAISVKANTEGSSETIFWSSNEIAVNAQVSEDKTTSNPVTITYSDSYAENSLSEGEKLCLQYALLDDANGGWQTIATLNDRDGVYNWQPTLDEANCYRIRLAVCDAGGTTTDEIATVVLAFEIASSESANAVSVDTTADKFQSAAEKGEAVDIVYDSEWFAINGVSKLELGYVLSRSFSSDEHTESKYVVLEKAAPASGIHTTKLPFRYGEFRWQLKAIGEDGELVGNALSASYTNPNKIFMIIMQ